MRFASDALRQSFRHSANRWVMPIHLSMFFNSIRYKRLLNGLYGVYQAGLAVRAL
jgi:hypothetical protein